MDCTIQVHSFLLSQAFFFYLKSQVTPGKVCVQNFEVKEVYFVFINLKQQSMRAFMKQLLSSLSQITAMLKSKLRRTSQVLILFLVLFFILD